MDLITQKELHQQFRDLVDTFPNVNQASAYYGTENNGNFYNMYNYGTSPGKMADILDYRKVVSVMYTKN